MNDLGLYLADIEFYLVLFTCKIHSHFSYLILQHHKANYTTNTIYSLFIIISPFSSIKEPNFHVF
jgi:hypothetical protein